MEKLEDLSIVVGCGKNLPEGCYCEVTVLGNFEQELFKHTTQRIKSENPAWNDVIKCQVGSNITGLVVRVFESRFLSDLLLGAITFKLSPKNIGDNLTSWYPLAKPGKPSTGAQIYLEIVYGSDTANDGPTLLEFSISGSDDEVVFHTSPNPQQEIATSENHDAHDSPVEQINTLASELDAKKPRPPMPPPPKDLAQTPPQSHKTPYTVWEAEFFALLQTPMESVVSLKINENTSSIEMIFERSKDILQTVTLILPNNSSREFKVKTKEDTLELGVCESLRQAIQITIQIFQDTEDDIISEEGEELAVSDVDDDEEEPIANQGAEVLAHLLPAIEKFRRLHGEDLCIFFNAEQPLVRLAFYPETFISPLLCEIWKIDIRLPIIIHLITSLVGKHPRVKTFQTKHSDFLNWNIQKKNFGLSWFLEKRLEIFFMSNWPITHENLLIDTISVAVSQILNCPATCMICESPLAFPMLKPSICDKPLCSFGYQEFALGFDVMSEIIGDPAAVDLLINFTQAAALGKDPKRFTPFPTHLQASAKIKDDVGMFITTTVTLKKNPNDPVTPADCEHVAEIIEKFPSVQQMTRHASSVELKEELDKSSPLAYPLLLWILASNRAHLVKLKLHEHVPLINTPHQYLLLSSTAKKEHAFTIQKKQQGALFAFHGSGAGNWHSILRNGLKNLSGTNLMSTGAAYGKGIYLADSSSVSWGYSKSGQGWSKSIHTNEFRCISLCEVVDNKYVPNPYYVVSNEDHVIGSVKTSSLELPATEYSKLFQHQT